MIFTTQPMQDIMIFCIEQISACSAGKSISFETLDPDLGEGYAGAMIHIEDTTYIYRSYKSWTDLAELLMCKMLTPEKSTYPLVKTSF